MMTLKLSKKCSKINDYNVRQAAVTAFIKFANEENLKEIARKFANNEIHNNETLYCIISLDEKLLAPKRSSVTS